MEPVGTRAAPQGVGPVLALLAVQEVVAGTGRDVIGRLGHGREARHER